MNDFSDHISFEQLADFVDGRLSTAEVAQVEAHLGADCATCQQEVAWLQETTAVMAEAWQAPPRVVRANVLRAFRHYVPANGRLETVEADQPPTPWLRRLFKPRLSWVTAVIAVIVLFLASGSFYRSWAEEVVLHSATVVEMSGTAEMQRVGSDSWQPVTINSRLSPGDKIRTGEDGEAGLRFFENNITYLTSNTQIEIIAFSDRRDGGERIITLKQLSGQIFSSGWPPGSELTYLVITSPQSVMTVQALGYDLMVDAGGNTEVSVINGCAEIVSYDVAANAGFRQQTGSICDRQPPMQEKPQPIVPIQEL